MFFKISTNLRFGEAESEKLGEIVKEHGFLDLAIIVDKGVKKNAQVVKAVESLKQASIAYEAFINDSVEPTYDYLENFKGNLAGKKIQCMIGIGGGSALDLTKGLAVLLANEGPAISFRGFPKLKNRPLPVIAIPTTAGTGSEATYNAVFTDNKEKKKLGINSTLNFPVCAIVDPLITVNCPKNVTVSSGADALVHTLESYMHRNHTPISRMFSREAFRLIFNNLIKVLDEPANIEVRAGLALGAYLAGIALINSGSGPSGAFSYPLGAVYHVPHGYAGAVFLPHITRINVEKGCKDYAQLYDLIDSADLSLSVDEKNIRFAQKIQRLMDKLEVPKSLSYYKLGPKDIEFMIEQYDVLKAAIAQNPIEITKEEVRKMMLSLA